tara:strand:+ start:129 stop:683 length:555 start_codon:yes stop_codon:yes gene_type:complete
VTLHNNPNINEKILRKLHPELLQWAMFCVDFDQDTARDILQQTYLKVLEGRAVFSKQSSLKTWLFSVIRLTALEAFRQNVKPELLLEDHEFDEAEVSEERAFGRDLYAREIIDEALHELSLAQREIIYLAFYKDFSLSEIAEILGVSIGTVRTQYHRAKVRLKILLTEAESKNTLGGSYEEQYS